MAYVIGWRSAIEKQDNAQIGQETMPFISVIIPCYNSSNYIVRCLAALERQRYKNFDVIVVDDCSKDNTVEVIKEYQSTSLLAIQLLHNEVNSGPARSRNKGIAASNAEYICFCDSDDWYDDDYLSLMIERARENDADIVFCGYKLVVEGKRTVLHPLSLSYSSFAHKASVLNMGTDALWAMMVRRNIIVHVPLPDIRNGEDMAIIPLLIVNSNCFGFVKDCTYNYYCRQDSISMTPTLKVVDSLIASFEHIKRNMPKQYSEETEFIGIRNLVYGAFLNLFKCGWHCDKANRILSDFECDFPQWKNNPFISSLSLFKKVFVKMVSFRQWTGVFLMSKIHSFLTK